MVLVLETKAETNPTFLSQVTTVRWTLASRSKQSYVATYDQSLWFFDRQCD